MACESLLAFEPAITGDTAGAAKITFNSVKYTSHGKQLNKRFTLYMDK